MLDDKTDEQLMLLYTDNNIDAFQILYGRYKTALFRFILRQVEGQATAEELFQELWAKVIKCKDTYQTTASFRTFIYQIARNTLIDWYRRQNIRKIEIQTNSETMSTQVDTLALVNEPSHNMEKQQTYQNVIDAIKVLPQDQRDVFLLKEEANLSIKEIAAVTQVNAETAKSRYRYAIKQLKILLGQNDDN